MFNCRRFRGIKQFAAVKERSLRGNLARDTPIGDVFTFAECSSRERQPDTIVSKPKILRRFGYAIRREPLGKIGIIPVRVEHKWRTHDHSAPPIEPLFLL